jgi:hypothetical protein
VNKVNELAARHQNYGSLYYNQEGFSGALSKMPTPSNMPRMSTEDEALMWEILDFGASSEGNNPSKFGDLAIPHPDNIETVQSRRRNNGSTTTQGVSEQPEKTGKRPSTTQSLSTHGISFLDSMSDPTGESAFPGWPFNTRSGGDLDGQTIPDIPDWMILGDYMAEHL